MFELYAESYQFTTVYTLYITLLLSVLLRVLWMLSVEAPLFDTWVKKVQFQLSASDSAYKNKADLTIDKRLLILKKIKMKVASDDEAFFFSPNSKDYHYQEEKNEKGLFKHFTIIDTIVFNRVPVGRK